MTQGLANLPVQSHRGFHAAAGYETARATALGTKTAAPSRPRHDQAPADDTHVRCAVDAETAGAFAHLFVSMALCAASRRTADAI